MESERLDLIDGLPLANLSLISFMVNNVNSFLIFSAHKIHLPIGLLHFFVARSISIWDLHPLANQPAILILVLQLHNSWLAFYMVGIKRTLRIITIIQLLAAAISFI